MQLKSPNDPSTSRAWAASGVWQLPPSRWFSRRSAKTACLVGRWSSRPAASALRYRLYGTARRVHLAAGGQKLVCAEVGGDVIAKPQAVKSCRSQHRRVKLPGKQLPQSSVDVAPQRNNL